VKVEHRIDLGTSAMTLGGLWDVKIRFDIPDRAVLMESEDTYELAITWEDDEI
jgi:hypothetical protein